MEFSLGPKQIFNTQVNQLIEEEVEKRIRERLLKDEPGESLKKRLFPEDDKDDDEKFKTLYQERLEKTKPTRDLFLYQPTGIVKRVFFK